MNAVPGACGVCGSPVESGATFCPRCGAALRMAPPAPAPIGPATGVAAPVPPTQSDGPGRPVPWPTGPQWASSAVLASPGARLGAWLLDGLIFGVAYVIGLVLTVPLALALASFGAAGFIVGLFLPQVLILVAAVWIIAWEGRTGKRPGTAMVGLRTVEIRTGRPPGFGRALGKTLVLGAFGGIVVAVEGGIGSRGSEVPTGVAVLLLVAVVVVPILMIVSCGWDSGRLRQGWHEKASGTTTIRLVRAAPVAYAYAPVAAQVPGGPPVPPAPVASPAVEPLAGPIGAPPGALPQAGQSGLIADVPGFAPAPPHRPAAPAAAPRPVTPAAPVSEDEAIELTRVSARGPAPAGPALLVFDTGEVVGAVRSGLVGRAPLGDDGELLVPIADPDLSISKTHLSFEPDPYGVWVVDLGSTNGTEVESPGGTPRPVLAGERVHVPFGGAVRFGTRSFLVERG